jgi:hypothetical protein
VLTDGPQAATIVCAMKARFTEKQGQYLAFMYYYTKVNGQPPAEADMQRYFESRRLQSTRWCLRWRPTASLSAFLAKAGQSVS